MATAQPVPFVDLAWANLDVDRVYQGGRSGHIGDDPLGKLLPVGNAGGFRFIGSPTAKTVKAVVLFSSHVDPDWPDHLDVTAGTFTYYGDNKAAGRSLHDTPRKGNAFLRDVFELAASGEAGRRQVPPIFLFSRADKGHDVRFRGLLVPGSPLGLKDEDLVAVWRSSAGARFQNYRATLTVLDVGTLARDWLDQRVKGPAECDPEPLERWILTGVSEPLRAPRVRAFRSKTEQLPVDTSSIEMLDAVYQHFDGRPHDFEACAAQIWMMIAPATDEVEITRPSRDGGRDAIGKYVIGPASDQVRIDFALEAKCYARTNAVGVREVSRLISRLRHRNFGVLVTTSYVNKQAYEEIREDGHPVVIVSGADVVDALRAAGTGDRAAVIRWLEEYFPSAGR